MKSSILIAAAAVVALGITAQRADARIAGGLNFTTHTLRSDALTGADHIDAVRHMRKFNDDQPDDPPQRKTPTGSTNGSGSGTHGGPYGYGGPHFTGYPAGYVSLQYWSETRKAPPLACKGRPC